MLLREWPLEVNMFDNEILGGPVPKMFAEEPEVAKENMLKDPVKLHADIVRVNKNFFAPEHVDLQEANAVLKKPR
jgi:hypothetical protein